MTAPRLEIDLDKIHHNASELVQRLAARGIRVTGVTKAALGSPSIARTMLRAGVDALGDSRLSNLARMRGQRHATRTVLMRSPMQSQVASVVTLADTSMNTELAVIRQLSYAAGRAGVVHGILLMVELGDLREGILPADVLRMVGDAVGLPNLVLRGIGTNLACRHGVVPDPANMAQLSDLADSIDVRFGLALETVSGGNSANLAWALADTAIGRINDLRLGEAILLGRDPLDRSALPGLYTDAIRLVAEVIESKTKPARPFGRRAESAFGPPPPSETTVANARGLIQQAILAVGRQDIDPEGLRAPAGVRILGSSSDHLVVDCGEIPLTVGAEVCFDLNYSCLLRAMTSPFVSKVRTARCRTGRATEAT